MPAHSYYSVIVTPVVKSHKSKWTALNAELEKLKKDACAFNLSSLTFEYTGDVRPIAKRLSKCRDVERVTITLVIETNVGVWRKGKLC